MLGGSSSINDMVYALGNDRDYNEWSEAGNVGWDWENVWKSFKKSERNQIDQFVEYDDWKLNFMGNKLRVIEFFTKQQ